MKPVYWIILAVFVLILGLYVGWDYLGRTPGPDALATQALSASDPKARLDAVMRLTQLKKREIVVPQLRHVMKESKDPKVLVVAVAGLAELNDAESLPVFIASMNHTEKSVRVEGYNAVRRHFGGTLPENLVFRADDPPENRSPVVQRLQEIYEQNKNKPLP